MGIFRRLPLPGNPRGTGGKPPAQSPTAGELSEAEWLWLNARLDELARAGVDLDDAASLGAYYDAQFRAWSDTSPADRLDPNLIVDRVGAGVGNILVRQLSLAWVVATDQWGTELALYGERGNVFVFPPNMIGKRWADGATDFVPQLVEGVARSVRDVQAEHHKKR